MNQAKGKGAGEKGASKAAGNPAAQMLPGLVDRAAWESTDHRGRAVMLVDVLIEHCGPGEHADAMQTLRGALQKLDPKDVHTVREAFQAARLEIGRSVLSEASRKASAATYGEAKGSLYR